MSCRCTLLLAAAMFCMLLLLPYSNAQTSCVTGVQRIPVAATLPVITIKQITISNPNPGSSFAVNHSPTAPADEWTIIVDTVIATAPKGKLAVASATIGSLNKIVITVPVYDGAVAAPTPAGGITDSNAGTKALVTSATSLSLFSALACLLWTQQRSFRTNLLVLFSLATLFYCGTSFVQAQCVPAVNITLVAPRNYCVDPALNDGLNIFVAKEGELCAFAGGGCGAGGRCTPLQSPAIPPA